MNSLSLPLKKKGYKILSQLGNNHLGGRITYKAVRTQTNCPVVIKYFRWLGASSWSGYNAIEREIATLKSLDRPNIPKYLDSFECDGDLVIVTEYIEAPNASGQCFTPEQVQSIAIALLEILEYLHAQNPPIIHRDLKPENILVDKDMRVYLVDFGLARANKGETAASTTLGGTLGFMAPESMLGKPRPSSDLYSLGITLVCLLYQIGSENIGNYINPDFSVNFKQLPSPSSIPSDLTGWLKKLTQPSLPSRIATAGEARLLLKGQSHNAVGFARLRHLVQTPRFKKIAIGLSVVAVVGVGIFGRQFLIQSIGNIEKNHNTTSSKPILKPKTQFENEPKESKPPLIFSDREETSPSKNHLKTFLIVVLIFNGFLVVSYSSYLVVYQHIPVDIALENVSGLIFMSGVITAVLIVLSIA